MHIELITIHTFINIKYNTHLYDFECCIRFRKLKLRRQLHNNEYKINENIYKEKTKKPKFFSYLHKTFTH